MSFTIDFFELSFLADVCIPPVPIARHNFFMKLIGTHYHKMTPDERKEIYKWITENPRFSLENAECRQFKARYDPENQFIVTYKLSYRHEESKVEAYLFEDKYFIDDKMYLSKGFITKTEKI